MEISLTSSTGTANMLAPMFFFHRCNYLTKTSTLNYARSSQTQDPPRRSL
ncbi:unnamed protein product [Brassica oleracea var. botrytis]